ncbi:MAG TPA: dihydrolipoamide acetyltransferase family protein [Gaiellales bacterium]|nr:dihydrolipoamide acetyltransferase family protein [Gaiellales bacterium]
MAVDVIMPVLGVAQDSGRVIRWLSAEGDVVRKGDPLIEVETDKVTVELEAPADGTLATVTAHVGDDVPVGTVIALILATGEAEPGPTAGATGRAPASPLARRMAREAGIDLAALAEQLGRPVQAIDVTGSALPAASAAPGAVAPPPVAPATGDLEPVSNAWRTMAARTLASWTSTPHFAVQRDVDASRLLSWQHWARQHSGAHVTITDLLVRSVAFTLRSHPALTRSWSGDGLVTSPAIGIGLAVALDDGLVVPVIHDADELDLPTLTSRREDLVGRAREGRLQPDDVQGGTFTISNLGMYGADAFTAIINPPQAAILAVGRIADRVVAVCGLPAVRPMLTLTLSCDHRVVDGARGSAFLQALAETIEEPASLVA